MTRLPDSRMMSLCVPRSGVYSLDFVLPFFFAVHLYFPPAFLMLFVGRVGAASVLAGPPSLASL